MKKKNFRIQISKLRYEQNPFEKPAKNLEQNSLDSLLTSTTWKRGKKKKPKAANREKNKSYGKKKKGGGGEETKSCKQRAEQKLKKKKKGILTLTVSVNVKVISFNERI